MKKLESVPGCVAFATGLYLVSTPIGNLRDITLRALDVLRAADVVLCEDTRVTGKLLGAYDIRQKLLSYNDHNAARQRQTVLDALLAGQVVALVSDAGTPLISDPGYKLVRDCLEQGLPVFPVPGANAVLPALQLSGLPSDAFVFAGFTPPKGEARRTMLSRWQTVEATLVFYETGPRLAASLTDMQAVFGDRQAAVVREITKMFEESRRGSLAELVAHYETADAPKGEIVVLVDGPAAARPTEDAVAAALRQALQTMSVKDAAAFVATALSLPRKELYQHALRLKADAGEDEA